MDYFMYYLWMRQRIVWGTAVFAGVVFACLVVPAASAKASHCFPFTIAGPQSGLLFENYESHEYVDHLLVLHLKLKTPDNTLLPTWRMNFNLMNDSCGNDISNNPLLTVVSAPGDGYFSVRFTSSTHFDLWNDETNIPLMCPNCSQDIPARPGYYEFVLQGVTDDSLNSFNSGTYRIRDDAPDPPILNETLPTPANCTSPSPTGVGLFDNYERTEYRNGFLTYHFRLNANGAWRDSIIFHDANCNGFERFDPFFGQTIAPYSRYFSIRFTSLNHFDLWNDETNQIEPCPGCSVDIPLVTPGQPFSYISFEARDGDSRLASTPFPILENRPPQSPDPVIIIPGILGSADKNGVWVIDPIMHGYDNLIATLEANGYIADENLFTMPYDWEQSNILTAIQLEQKIDEVQEICECGKVDLVAHSMGGLVARQYIQSNDYGNDVDQLVFLGTPHLGAPKAYLMWEAGENDFTFSDKATKFIFSKEAKKAGFPILFDYVRNKPILSVQELLPTFDYLLDVINVSTDVLRAYPNNYPRNQFLENLNDSVNTLVDSDVRATNIVGDTANQDTIRFIRTVSSSDLPLWEHGYPEGFDSPTSTDNGLVRGRGDQTVPQNSAEFIPSSDLYRLNSSHGELPTAGEEIVVKILTGKDPTISVHDWHLPGLKILILKILSPVDIMITAPDGKRIGKDFSTNEEVNEIPGAFYSGFLTDNEYATIPNPLDGDYTISTLGTGSGEYTIAADFISDTSEATSTVNGQTEPGKEIVYELNLAIADSVITVAPLDTTRPLTTASPAGTLGQSGWYISHVEVSLSADDQDGSGVFQTEYSLDNGFTWFEATSSVVLQGEGIHSLQYHSTDYAGNIEPVKSLEIKIDTIPPEATIRFNPDQKNIRIDGVDMNPTTVLRSGKVYTVKDQAGHTLEMNFSQLDIGKSVIVAALSSLRYDGNTAIVFGKQSYILGYRWSLKNGVVKDLTQAVSRGWQLIMKATYISATGTTVISQPGKVNQTLPGLVILSMNTNKGVLNITY